jgi:hypothetical protein
LNPKTRTLLLGLMTLGFLGLAFVENTAFFGYAGSLFSNPPLAVVVVFVHNVLVISLILLSMTFYVGLVLSFFPKRKYEYVVLEHPRVFSFVFTIVIIVVSILRASMLIYNEVRVDMLAFIVLMSMPNGIIEGYGIFQTLQKTFKQNMQTKDLIFIYTLFFVAAIVEVGFMNMLRLVVSVS